MKQIDGAWMQEGSVEAVEELLQQSSGLVGVEVDFEELVRAAPVEDDAAAEVPDVEGQVWAVYESIDDRGVYTGREGAHRFILGIHSTSRCSKMKTVWNSGDGGEAEEVRLCASLSEQIRSHRNYHPVFPD